jgi:hypothetical protein
MNDNIKRLQEQIEADVWHEPQGYHDVKKDR